MFKCGSIENELMQAMAKQLVENKIESRHGFNKLTKAIDYLNAAADIFEKAGLNKEASEIVLVLKGLTNNWQDKLPGGLADNKVPEDFDPKALEKGKKVELEHTDDEKVAVEIAMDHLTEDPKYYDKLEKIEKK